MLLFFIVSCGAKDLQLTRSLRRNFSLNSSAVHFFVGAHPDDWQIYMGDFAYDAIVGKSKTIIIIPNAGDEGFGKTYWQAREDASIASVRAVLGYPLSTGDKSEVDEILTFNGKTLRHHTLSNVSMYFLRFPDGMKDGSGTEASKHQSMFQLMEGDIADLTTIDGANTYTWNELTTVLKSIINKEYTVSTKDIRFYIQDPGTEKKISHSDHLAVQKVIREVSSTVTSSDCRQLAFEDYRVKNKTENSSKGNIGKKLLVYSAYDNLMISRNQPCGLCQRSHYEWLLRSYIREYGCEM